MYLPPLNESTFILTVCLEVYVQNLINPFFGWLSNRKGRRENFQLPSFNPRQQAKLLKSSFSSIYSSFDLFYDLLKRLNPSAMEAKFAQNYIVVEEEAGAVVVPVVRNGNIFIASVLQ